MIVGQIIEELIKLKREVSPLSDADEAINEACNILSVFPRLEDGIDIKGNLSMQKDANKRR